MCNGGCVVVGSWERKVHGCGQDTADGPELCIKIPLRDSKIKEVK